MGRPSSIAIFAAAVAAGWAPLQAGWLLVKIDKGFETSRAAAVPGGIGQNRLSDRSQGLVVGKSSHHIEGAAAIANPHDGDGYSQHDGCKGGSSPITDSTAAGESNA